MNVNYSIPVTLFDYRESDNPLYSYAKLRIFYVGMTGDKRLFTKKFSDQLIGTLPYVPVVGYYDEEDEDFRGHNIDVQYIYGMVPEDTNVEYVEEDGKEYAVCDVILYTGRRDKTGEIAKKIVGKQHSLELNPEDTKYKINRGKNNETKSIEFTSGSLLGLSVLGDNENPAFSGSGFFTKSSEFMRMFEGFKEELEKFTKQNQQRGENMTGDTVNVPLEATASEDVTSELLNEEVITNEEENFSDETVQTELTGDEVEDSTITSENEEEENFSENEEDEVIEEKEALTREQKYAEFMRTTSDEIERAVMTAFYESFGDYVYVVQWSPFENVLVYIDFEDGNYYRVNFVKDEEETITFGEKEIVKPRFLTEDEINQVFTDNSDEEEETFNENGEEVNMGTNEEDSSNNEDDNSDDDNEEEGQEFTSTALDKSEREELEAYRKERKEKFLSEFEEDLDKDFLEKIRKNIATYSYDELEVILSKEFTRVSRENRQQTVKPKTFTYDSITNSNTNKSEAELAKELINRYK